jgi:hypothetical protein
MRCSCCGKFISDSTIRRLQPRYVVCSFICLKQLTKNPGPGWRDFSTRSIVINESDSHSTHSEMLQHTFASRAEKQVGEALVKWCNQLHKRVWHERFRVFYEENKSIVPDFTLELGWFIEVKDGVIWPGDVLKFVNLRNANVPIILVAGEALETFV